MRRREDTEFSSTWQGEGLCFRQRFRYRQFEIVEATAKLWHEMVIPGGWQSQLLYRLNRGWMRDKPGLCKERISAHMVDMVMGVQNHIDLCIPACDLPGHALCHLREGHRIHDAGVFPLKDKRRV